MSSEARQPVHVSVAVRVRPLAKNEGAAAFETSETAVVEVSDGAAQQEFGFERVFGPSAST